MKDIFFVPVEDEMDYKIPKEIVKKKVGLVASVQYLAQLKEVKKKFVNAVLGGQVLGCNASNAMKINEDVDCYYFLGNGRFHAIEIARRTGKEVYIASGDKIGEKEIQLYERMKKVLLSKFYAAKKVGVLVSTKYGQEHMKQALSLKKKLVDKEIYIFIDDTFNIDSLEDFNDIDIFINTACPRIESKKVIYIGDVLNAI